MLSYPLQRGDRQNLTSVDVRFRRLVDPLTLRVEIFLLAIDP